MLTLRTTPPQTEDELLQRADALSGRQLSELAQALDRQVPPDLRRNKGWVGQLIEGCLGATAGNKAIPDFELLGVELKTLPVNETGAPRETTYISTVPLANVEDLDWSESPVMKKLARVLWVPIHAPKDAPIGERVVGRSVLWSPNRDEEARLREDWESHIDTIKRGYVEAIKGRDGAILQVRPKAADSSRKTWTVNEDGNAVMTLPRGFYLRTLFTEYLVRRYILEDPDAIWER